MKQKILITSIVAIIAIGTIYGLNVMQSQTQTYNIGNVPPPTPLLQILPGEPVKDLNEASLKSGHAKLTPTYLPLGYQIKRIQYVADENTVGMLISKFAITEETTDQEFTWKQRGIGLEIAKIPTGFDKTAHISQLKSQGSKHIVIEGKDFVFHDIVEGVGVDGNVVHSPAELVMFDGQTSIRVSGFISSDEMMKIVQSVK